MAKTNAQLQEEVDGLQKQLVDASTAHEAVTAEKAALETKVTELQEALDKVDGDLQEALDKVDGTDDAKVADLEVQVDDLTKQLEAASKASKSGKKEVVTLSDHELIEVVFRGGRGSVYHGIDPWNNDQPISLEPGDPARVSPRKAKQLAEDYPNDFEVDGHGPERGDKAFVAQTFDEDDEDN